VNAAELARQMLEAKAAIDAALEEYQRCIFADAKAYKEAKMATASAYLATEGTVQAREAHVDQSTAEVQTASRLATDLKRSAGLAVDAKKQWLSALQSIASLTKAEAQLAAWEPREVSA
jgi:hypothetical protein